MNTAKPASLSVKHPLVRLKLVPAEPGPETVEAQFNPKEVQIDKTIGWQDHPAKDGSFGLEFTGGKGARTMSIELLFDGSEQCRSVLPEIDKLNALTLNVGTAPALKRPPTVLVVWGAAVDEVLPRFPAVIESLSVKYQMFATDGRVLRATATVKLKEAGTIFTKKKR